MSDITNEIKIFYLILGMCIAMSGAVIWYRTYKKINNKASQEIGNAIERQID